MWAANHPDIRRSEYHRQLAIRQETQRPPTCIPVQLKSVVKCTHDGNYMQQETDVLWRTIEENISKHFYTLLTSWFRLTCLLQSCHEYYCRGEKSEWILTLFPSTSWYFEQKPWLKWTYSRGIVLRCLYLALYILEILYYWLKPNSILIKLLFDSVHFLNSIRGSFGLLGFTERFIMTSLLFKLIISMHMTNIYQP